MYTLDCPYYTKESDTLQGLIATIIADGMDPDYEILKDGKPTGENAIDHIQF